MYILHFFTPFADGISRHCTGLLVCSKHNFVNYFFKFFCSSSVLSLLFICAILSLITNTYTLLMLTASSPKTLQYSVFQKFLWNTVLNWLHLLFLMTSKVCSCSIGEFIRHLAVINLFSKWRKDRTGQGGGERLGQQGWEIERGGMIRVWVGKIIRGAGLYTLHKYIIHYWRGGKLFKPASILPSFTNFNLFVVFVVEVEINTLRFVFLLISWHYQL